MLKLLKNADMRMQDLVLEILSAYVDQTGRTLMHRLRQALVAANHGHDLCPCQTCYGHWIGRMPAPSSNSDALWTVGTSADSISII